MSKHEAAARAAIEASIARMVEQGLKALVGDGSPEQVRYIRLSTPIRTLAPLRDYPMLDTLHLTKGSKLDLSQLAGHPALKELNLEATVKDLAPLADLPALRTLRLSKGWEGLDALSLPALETLAISATAVEDLGFLAGMPNLKSLSLGARRSAVRDLGPVAGLKKLEALHLHGSQVVDLGPLRGLSRLRHLDLDGTKTLEHLDGIEDLRALRRLDANLSAVRDLGPLEGHPALEELRLRGTRVEDLKPLLSCKALRVLYLERSKLRSIAGLGEQLPGLETLWIWGTKVKDLSPLKGLCNLKDLNAAALKKVKGDAALRSLSSLETLDLEGTVVDPAHIVGLPALRRVRGCEAPLPSASLTEEDLEPATTLTRARSLGFGELLHQVLLPGRGVADLDLSDNGRLLAVAVFDGGEGAICILRTDDRAMLARFGGPGLSGLGVAFTDESRVLHYVVKDAATQRNQLWRVALPDGAPERVEELGTCWHAALARDRQGRFVAIREETVRVRDLVEDRWIATIPFQDPNGTSAVSFAGSGPRLYLYGRDGEESVVLHDPVEGRDLGRWPAASSWSGQVVASPDGRILCTKSEGGRGMVALDTLTGRRLQPDLFDESAIPRALAITGDGSLLVTLSRQAWAFPLPSGEPLIRGPATPVLTGTDVVCAASARDVPVLAFGLLNRREGDHRVTWLRLVEER